MATIENNLPEDKANQAMKDFEAYCDDRPWLEMVNSDKGITHLHAPLDVIIDESIPKVIRDSCQTWNKINELEDAKCLITDRCYVNMHQGVISFVKTTCQFDLLTMGNVANAGLMAQKADENRSHDKTFEMYNHVIVRARDKSTNKVYMERIVNKTNI